MLLGAEELIAPGGPSAPVWAFFSAISLALIAIIPQLVSTKRAAREAKDAAVTANESAHKAETNTTAVSNGFAGRVDRKLDEIIKEQIEHRNALQRHLEWHAHKGE